jgi:sugar phosphate isomerase/epimerase
MEDKTMELTKRKFLKQLTGLAAFAGLPARAAERYQLGCQTLPYRAFPFSRALEGIRKAGYRYVMPSSTHEGKPAFAPALTSSGRAALKRQVQDAGLEPLMAFAGLGMDIRKPEGMKTFLAELDLAVEFGMKFVVGAGPWYYTRFPTVPKRARDWEQECDEFCAAIEQAVKHAESIGITITMKPHTGITATGAACLKLMKRIVSDRFKICWDAGNVSYYEGINPDPDLPDLAPYVKAVCIKDHQGGRAEANFPVPGSGQIDHELMFRTLFAGGFSGPLALERVDGRGEPVAPEVLDQRIAQAYNFLAPMLEKTAGA